MDSKQEDGSASPARANAGFEDTRWTALVEMAANPSSPQAGEALERLCRTYWPPVYAFLRRNGHSSADAEDLCQGFFVHLLQNQRLSRPTREQGKFRSWLLTCLKNYTRNEHDRQSATVRHPRGGFVPLEDLGESEGFLSQLRDSDDVDQTFDSLFAHRLVGSVRQALRAEYNRKGKDKLYAALEPFLSGILDGETTSREAGQLRMTEGAIRVAHSRLKDRFGELLREHVHQLVLDPADVDAEIRHLVKAWLSR